MHRISKVYVELSQGHICGGCSEIAEQWLTDTSLTEEGRNMKGMQLKDFKSRASANVREMVQEVRCISFN
jgi:hypothetical protein